MTTNTAPAAPAFRVLGTTDEITACEHCGRVDLKGTIILGALDVDGNVEGVTYFGAVCGARAAGWTVKDLRKAAGEADRARREAERAARMAAFDAALDAAEGCQLAPSMCRKARTDCAEHA